MVADYQISRGSVFRYPNAKLGKFDKPFLRADRRGLAPDPVQTVVSRFLFVLSRLYAEHGVKRTNANQARQQENNGENAQDDCSKTG